MSRNDTAEPDRSSPFLERALEWIIYSSRWLMAPVYLGLIAALAILIVTFFRELYLQAPQIMSMDETDIILLVLTLVDLSLAGNLRGKSYASCSASQGGLEAMKVRNEVKAKFLYDAIDSSDGFYRGRAERAARSTMNVTFNLPSSELERQFCDEATRLGMDGLAGHRSSGGIRASIYNAFPLQGVHELVGFMKEFASQNS